MATRDHLRHDMAIRRLTVSHIEELTPSMVRVTLIGDALEGFSAPGPADHMKVFFPDPATHELTVPELRGDGIHRPTDGVIISTEEQSFTPFFGLADTVNGISASYPSPADAWNSKVAPPLRNTDYQTLDGGRRLMATVSLDFVPYDGQVQRLVLAQRLHENLQ